MGDIQKPGSAVVTTLIALRELAHHILVNTSTSTVEGVVTLASNDLVDRYQNEFGFELDIEYSTIFRALNVVDGKETLSSLTPDQNTPQYVAMLTLDPKSENSLNKILFQTNSSPPSPSPSSLLDNQEPKKAKRDKKKGASSVSLVMFSRNYVKRILEKKRKKRNAAEKANQHADGVIPSFSNSQIQDILPRIDKPENENTESVAYHASIEAENAIIKAYSASIMAEIQSIKAENASLKIEIASLKAENASIKAK